MLVILVIGLVIVPVIGLVVRMWFAKNRRPGPGPARRLSSPEPVGATTFLLTIVVITIIVAA
jgi:hypothetical protein